MFKGLSDIQHHLIPTDVILSSWTAVGSGLILLPTLFLSLPLGFMFANLIAWCIPPARRALDSEAKEIKGKTLKESIKIISIVLIVLLIIVTPLSIVGVFNYFYVTPSGVTLRPLFSLKEKHYDWSDIVRIHGKFWDAQNNTFNREYVLYMKDGRKVDLANPASTFINAYDKIKPFIRAQSQISYDYIIKDTRMFTTPYTDYDRKFMKIIQNKD